MENKVTVTKNEFINLIADVTMENSKDNLSVILCGGIVTGIFVKKIFGDNDSVSITKDEYCDLTASAITEFVKDKTNKGVATPVSLLALIISGEIKFKLFKEEDI